MVVKCVGVVWVVGDDCVEVGEGVVEVVVVVFLNVLVE